MKIWRILFWILIIILIILTATLGLKSLVRADSNSGTNIDSTNYSAWSDISGWWDFHGTHNVKVGTSSLSGWASSSVGEIVLNCATAPSGNICSDSDFKVTNTDGGGELAGCAYNDSIGFISFSCKDGDCDGSLVADASSTCVSASNWGVIIDSSGNFTGQAWNDIDGYISFNGSPTSSYKVVTDWRPGRLIGYLESATIDTQVVGGATLNSITWYGTQPVSTIVDFQIAVSNSASGPWSFFGPGGATDTYYGASCPSASTGTPSPGTPVCVDRNLTTNSRYLRYKTRLQSNTGQSATPTITDIILNWSL